MMSREFVRKEARQRQIRCNRVLLQTRFNEGLYGSLHAEIGIM